MSFLNLLPHRISQRLTAIYFTATSFSFQRSLTTAQTTTMASMTVKKIPALKDNFMYLVVCNETRKAAVVDPVEPDRVLEVVKQDGVQLNQLLTTHHHWDHAGGNEALSKKFQENADWGKLLVYGGNDDRIDCLTNRVGQDDTFEIGKLRVRCLSTPCHTSSHICYYIETDQDRVVFTGDTLFLAGCGRFFEGTPEQMYDALINKLSALPDDTKVYCGHEYAVQNLRFGNTVEPDNADTKALLEQAQAADLEGRRALVPSTIGQEKRTNVFMRVHEATVQAFVGKKTPLETMQALRAAKDKF
ncbi:hydroxyacylglutathione hydrolase, mitochondrial isoform X1 [Anopheles bellator]|uniref:hydroxyacylglutathione hydrolase, mitochondrial isoform X1 n=3 Tax=Anopheles bellator TaxID=139047 RepID=UPI002648687D|nr:hydroxyacylglutathione hydrolase, mitochondrial isoform X1 [Anopheles bellator]